MGCLVILIVTEPAERHVGVQSPLHQPSRSPRYPPQHPFRTVALSKILILRSLSRTRVLILMELANLPLSSMCILFKLLPNLSIPDTPFSELSPTLIKSRFLIKPVLLLICIDPLVFFVVKEFEGTR